ncbi:MAG: aminoacyl-tRNA hydrolase [Lachnospiraceae bacterium]|nr:aminoacyl-tRNA hydrolase [Lachnospiraceae bacterium]
MYLIAGLGNPGMEYAATRHNIGFDMVTYLCDKYGISLRSKEHKALVGKGIIEGQKVMLAQPQTYMNLSGESLRALVDYYKLDIEDLIVIYDDISLEVGQIRVRPKGSAGGHNGIKNIINHLGTQEFARIKIGVGSKPEGGDLVKHVLGRFSKEEDGMVREIFGLAEEACTAIMTEGVDSAMNRVNGKKIER